MLEDHLINQHLKELEKLLHAVANQSRLIILFELSQGPKDTSTLMSILKMDSPNISYHLRILRSVDFIQIHKSGPKIFNALNTTALELFIEKFKSIFKQD